MEVAVHLIQPALAGLIIALILDRLIAKSNHASHQHSRDLDLNLVCDELVIEVHAKEQKRAQLTHSQELDVLEGSWSEAPPMISTTCSA